MCFAFSSLLHVKQKKKVLWDCKSVTVASSGYHCAVVVMTSSFCSPLQMVDFALWHGPSHAFGSPQFTFHPQYILYCDARCKRYFFAKPTHKLYISLPVNFSQSTHHDNNLQFVREHLICMGSGNCTQRIYTQQRCLLEICLCRYTAKLLVVGIKFDLDFSLSIIQSVWMTHMDDWSPCDALNYVGH